MSTLTQPSTASAVSAAADLVLSHFDAPLGATRRLRKPRALLYAVAAIVVLMLLWMALAKVDRVVRTQGRVIPSGKAQLLQHLEGGIVSKVFVKEGDVVKRGQNLIAVSDLMANASRGEKNAHLSGLMARAARLQAEAEGATRFTPPAGISANSPEVLNERNAFTARQGRLQQTTRVLEEQALQKRHETSEQQAQRKGLTQELDVARQQLALISNLIARNAGSQMELLDARAKVERLSTQIQQSETSAPRLAAAEQELRARMGEVIAQFRSEARSALADTQVELQRLRQEMSTENDRVTRTMVRAPADGIINKLLFNTVGGVVKPGDTLMELTPTDEAVVIEARVQPGERGSLQVGQQAIVRVAAFDYTVFGALKAKVTEVSADTLSDERGERYFRVGMAVAPQSLHDFGQVLSPGMTVSADAVTGQRTVLQYMLSPIRGIGSTAFRDRK
jgi:adhesin transport system membrane fusion protein